jgi:hypothetical protein
LLPILFTHHLPTEGLAFRTRYIARKQGVLLPNLTPSATGADRVYRDPPALERVGLFGRVIVQSARTRATRRGAPGLGRRWVGCERVCC